MTTFQKITAVSAVLIVTLLPMSAQLAQSAKQAPSAPIPSQILSAKRIFIANAGCDEMTVDDPIFSGGPARAYNQFYAAMKTWGHFDIVGSPADADLLFEVGQDVSAVTPFGKTSSSYIPQFRLKIRDPKTNALLWSFNVHAEFGLGQASSDRNFDQAINHLVAEVQGLLTPTLDAASSANR
ncbi:MAG TPA: hypothetical protein VMH04_22295 [Candidatus Solibacter sp.]|nr:hypothetical protein [Candidatus Solibacter sp.]